MPTQPCGCVGGDRGWCRCVAVFRHEQVLGQTERRCCGGERGWRIGVEVLAQDDGDVIVREVPPPAVEGGAVLALEAVGEVFTGEAAVDPAAVGEGEPVGDPFVLGVEGGREVGEGFVAPADLLLEVREGPGDR